VDSGHLYCTKAMIISCAISYVDWITLASMLALLSVTCIIYMHSILIELCTKYDDIGVIYKVEKLIVMNYKLFKSLSIQRIS
jgi:hypothetical protein